MEAVSASNPIGAAPSRPLRWIWIRTRTRTRPPRGAGASRAEGANFSAPNGDAVVAPRPRRVA